MTTIAVRTAGPLEDAFHSLLGSGCITTTVVAMGQQNTGDLLGGMRFAGINIPAGAVIDSATVTFLPGIPTTPLPELEIICEDADDPIDFTSPCDIDGRPRTTARVDWNPSSWGGGLPIPTPSFPAPVQEVIDRPMYAGDHLVVIIHRDGVLPDGNAWIIAAGYASGPSIAPLLTVTFTPPTPAVAPHIDDATISARPTQDASVAIPTDDATISAKPAEDRTISAGTGESTISAKPTEDKTI